MKHLNKILVTSSKPPIVEIDTSARAAYIRFSDEKIVQTLSDEKPGLVVAVDLDAHQEVVGIELIGVTDFTISALLKLVPIEAPRADLNATQYIAPGKHESLAPC